jgi:phytoene/squalene synthetase
MIRDVIVQPAKEGDCCGGSAGVVDLVRTQVERAVAGTIELPLPAHRDESQHLLAAFGATLQQFDVPLRLVMEFVEGCRDDAQTTRYATWNALRLHCDRVGGSVAKMIAAVAGATHSDVGRFADDLGAALRLMSIVANMQQDAEHGRIYLPLEDLARCRYPERELLANAGGEARAKVLAIQQERVQQMLTSASEGVCWLASDGSRLAAAMLIEVAQHQADRLASAEVGAGGSRLSMMTLIRLLPRAARLARRQSDQPMPSMR